LTIYPEAFINRKVNVNRHVFDGIIAAARA